MIQKSTHEGLAAPAESSGTDCPVSPAQPSTPAGTERPATPTQPSTLGGTDRFATPAQPSTPAGTDRASQQARLRILLREMAKVLLLGLVYYVWLSLTGLGIPCLFRLATGYLCPGCGITHCIMALGRHDFRGAFEANQLIFCLLPVAVPYGIFCAVTYVKRGERELGKGEIGVFIFLLIITVCFTLYRNGFLV